MELLIYLIGLGAFSFLMATGAEPVQALKQKLNIMDYDENTPPLKTWLVKLINCSLCFGFWIGLIATWSIPYAAFVALVAELINRALSSHSL